MGSFSGLTALDWLIVIGNLILWPLVICLVIGLRSYRQWVKTVSMDAVLKLPQLPTGMDEIAEDMAGRRPWLEPTDVSFFELVRGEFKDKERRLIQACLFPYKFEEVKEKNTLLFWGWNLAMLVDDCPKAYDREREEYCACKIKVQL